MDDLTQAPESEGDTGAAILEAAHTLFIEQGYHGTSMAAIVVIAGSFLRYILDDEPVARRYMNIGLVIPLL